jgi:hypothetical protein
MPDTNDRHIVGWLATGLGPLSSQVVLQWRGAPLSGFVAGCDGSADACAAEWAGKSPWRYAAASRSAAVIASGNSLSAIPKTILTVLCSVLSFSFTAAILFLRGGARGYKRQVFVNLVHESAPFAAVQFDHDSVSFSRAGGPADPSRFGLPVTERALVRLLPESLRPTGATRSAVLLDHSKGNPYQRREVSVETALRLRAAERSAGGGEFEKTRDRGEAAGRRAAARSRAACSVFRGTARAFPAAASASLRAPVEPHRAVREARPFQSAPARRVPCP